MADIDNSEDIIDSRDIIARIEELSDRDDDEDKSGPLDDDEREELESLRKVADQCEPGGPTEGGAPVVGAPR